MIFKDKKKLLEIGCVIFAIALSYFIISLPGCHTGINGTWILTEEFEIKENGEIGERISGSQLKIRGVTYEKYEITDGQVTYSYRINDADPVVYDLTLKPLGDNKYEFVESDGTIFVTAEIKGNKLTYYIGSGLNKYKMVFKRY